MAERPARRAALRVPVAVGLAATLVLGTTVAARAAPYAISDIGEAPTAGFRVSDIGAVPTAAAAAATPPDPLLTVALTISDIGPVTDAGETTSGPVIAGTDPLGSSPAAVYPGQMVSVPG